MNYKTWECPRCGQLITTPATTYSAVCACLMYNIPLYGNGPMASVTFNQTNMVDVSTAVPRPGELVVVPDDMSGLGC